MKIGIVGGTGNISQPIVKLLLEKGHEVVVFNRGQTAKAPDGVRVIAGDRSNREDFEESEPILEWLSKNLTDKDAVLIKGSHGLRMDRITAALEVKS